MIRSPLLFLVFFCVACATPRGAYKFENGIIVAGMSRIEVADVLGEPSSCDHAVLMGDYCEYDEARIIFRNDRVDTVIER